MNLVDDKIRSSFAESAGHPVKARLPVANPSGSISIFHLLATQASRIPDAVAIMAPGRAPLTYKRLLDHTESVVGTLNSMGLGRNDRVAMILPQGPELAAAFLAIAAGATTAPLNPSYLSNELDLCFSDLKAKALIVDAGTDSPARTVAKALGIPVIELVPVIGAEAGIFELKGEMRDCPTAMGFAEPEDVALVLQTSGTTSRPKVVPLTHANVCVSANNISVSLHLDGRDRCLSVMPLFHIHGLIGAALSSISAGASVVFTPGFFAPKFFDWIDEFRPTWYTAVPTMHRAILARAPANREIIARNTLRFIRSSSSALPPQVMREMEEVFRVPVIEAYGMTEASHQIASNFLPPRQRKAGSVGVSAGSEVAIMDPAGEFLGVEERGEVVIRGANIMGGYENNTAANERAFTRGWLRTGDEGYLDADGFLFITGRLKETINRGGEKIGPVEVENVLMNHPAVIEAVVFPVPHAQLGEDVGAVLVLRANMDATERELREFTAQRLTPFKVPQQIVFVDEIPKGATGKVQRIRLAEQLGINAHPHAPKEIAAYKSPESPLERDLASIWADVLGLKQVGANSNFFDLGGDSILATQIISRVLKKFRVQLPFLLFFDSPSVAEMARYLETAGAEEPVSEVSIIQPISRRQGKNLPLSFAQQRLWFLNQLEPDSPSYNVPKFIRLRGSLDVRALEQTLNAIIARHEVLRTTFPTHDGIPFQAVTEARSLLIAFIDLGEWRDADRNAELQRLLKAEAQQPFNLSADVMLRATLVRLGEEDHVLLLTMHHIASDGWSAGVLARELAAFYTSFTKGTPVSLPELPIQYADFSVWQQQWLQGEVLEKQLSYWKQRLANLQSLELPTDRPRPAEQTFHGAWRSFELSGALTDALHALSRGGEVTLFMTLLAAFQTLLHMYSGQDDIVIGSPIANRNRVETEGLIGFFVNTLVLRTDFSGNPSFRELLRRVRQVCVGAYAHQDVPFEKLVEELRIERDLSRNPLFQATFQLGNVPTEAVSFPCIDVEYIEGENTTTKFDLSLFTIEEGHQLKGSLGYSTDLFDGATIDKMLCHFQKLLDCVVKNPDQLLATLPILTDDERDNLQKKRANAQQLRFGAVDSLASREKLFKRQASFSAAKRALLEKRLRGEPTGGSEA